MKNNSEKWIWKKQIDKNRIKSWQDGRVSVGGSPPRRFIGIMDALLFYTLT